MAGEKRQIDTIVFDAMDGSPDRPCESVQPIERPGRDYARWRKVGYRSTDAILTTTEFASDASSADSQVDTYKSLAGTSVTIYDANGVTYENCTIVGVQIRRIKAVITESGAAIRIDAAWNVRAGASRVMGIIAQNSRARLQWPQDQTVPIGGYYNVYLGDRNGGAIDYGSPVNPRRIPAWPNNAAGKTGFGLGQFGSGACGYADGGEGWGQNAWGIGRFGFDAKYLNYLTDELADGTYNAAVVGYDPAGNASTGNAEYEIALAGDPEPPGVPSPDNYTQVTDTLTLSFPPSDDDEG